MLRQQQQQQQQQRKSENGASAAGKEVAREELAVVARMVEGVHRLWNSIPETAQGTGMLQQQQQQQQRRGTVR